jgi:hypothetical protein
LTSHCLVLPGASCFASSSCSVRPSSEGFRALPLDFTPGNWSVTVGRDKVSNDSPGNRRLHIIIGWYLERYTKSRTDKTEKGRIISEIEMIVQDACGGKGGAFITAIDGRWHEAPRIGRDKISRLLREALHTTYSSSSKQKRARRFLACV